MSLLVSAATTPVLPEERALVPSSASGVGQNEIKLLPPELILKILSYFNAEKFSEVIRSICPLNNDFRTYLIEKPNSTLIHFLQDIHAINRVDMLALKNLGEHLNQEVFDFRRVLQPITTFDLSDVPEDMSEQDLQARAIA